MPSTLATMMLLTLVPCPGQVRMSVVREVPRLTTTYHKLMLHLICLVTIISLVFYSYI